MEQTTSSSYQQSDNKENDKISDVEKNTFIPASIIIIEFS